MSAGFADSCYLTALSSAKKHRDLSRAVRYARLALCFNAEHDKARRLLGICLYELGYYGAAADALADTELHGEAAGQNAENTALLKDLPVNGNWRKSQKTLSMNPHQSVRTLLLRGCLYASKKRYGRAAKLFAAALELDTGNRHARAYLTEAVKRGFFI